MSWVLVGIFVSLGVWLVCRILPFEGVNWGSVSSIPVATISVTGEANSKQRNQIASFSAGVYIIKDKRDEATMEMNSKMEKLIADLKSFGIKSDDIKTTGISYVQNQEYYTEGGGQKLRPGNWSASSNVEVILREIDRASKLADLLASSGANNVYGPNFSLDDTKEFEKALVDEAMKNAREKAEAMARSGGRSLGKVVTVTEGATGSNPIMYSMRPEGVGGGGAPIEPGVNTVSKSLIVVFELK